MSRLRRAAHRGARVRRLCGAACVLGLGLALLAPDTGLACPTCKETLFDPGELPRTLSTARGYALSIGLMLAVPLGFVGGGSALILRAQRRKRRAGEDGRGIRQ